MNDPRLADLIVSAQKLVGVPYHHLGRNPEISLDCVGLVYAAAKEAGYSVLGVPNLYSKYPRPEELERQLSLFAKRAAYDDERAGLVYLLKRRSSLRAAHFAIRINKQQVIHAVHGVGVCVSDFVPNLVLSRWELI